MQDITFSNAVHPILQEIDSFYSQFGEEPARNRTKAIGAVTNEVIRKHLLQEGIVISSRDAFIKGFPTEWDLVVPKRGKVPELECIWSPTDVIAVIEIKYSGLYDREAIQRLNQTFSRLTQKYQHIKPYYFTIMETVSSRNIITDEALGCRALTLHWHRRSKGDYIYEITGDWERLVCDLRNLQGDSKNDT